MSKFGDQDFPRKKLEAIRKFDFRHWASGKPNSFRDLIIRGWPNKEDSILEERSATNLENFYKYIYGKNQINSLSNEDKYKLYRFFHTLEEDAIKIDDVNYDGEQLHNIFFVNLFNRYKNHLAKGTVKNIKRKSKKMRKSSKRKKRNRKTKRLRSKLK